MSARRPESDPERESRRSIVRRATLYMYGFFLAAVVVAAVGSAIVALVVSRFGYPFLETWLLISALVLIVPAIGLAVRELLGKRRRGGT